MTYVRTNIQAMEGYTPGEQPQGGKFIKLNTNENPYPCSPKVKAAIGRVCQSGLQRYPDPTATAFRMQLSEMLSDELPVITPDWILCGNGSDDILTIITRVFVDAGDLIRYPNPSYVLYKSLAEIQGARVDVVNFQPDWSLPNEFSTPQDRLKLAFLANPNSPSGTIVPSAAVAEIAAALPCPLVVDEAYVDFSETNCLSLVAENEKILVTRTLSKSYALAGLRFGYVVAQPLVIRELAKVKDSYNCDALSIAGATAAIEDQTWRTENCATILATRKRLVNELRGMGFECVDSQANFVWCKHPRHESAELYRDLKSVGVLVRYMNYPNWGDGIRVTVGTDDQIEAFLTILNPMLQ
ncbi:histidinol-phosphate transaminase [Bythopirellula polymerisocia]|nr:histidinol-phosphate transaminase [Bythopirellula polymerisocia]